MSDGKTGAGEFSLAGWRVLLADLGISHLNVLRRARLPDDLLAMDAPRVGPREFYRLWDALVEEADDPRLPLYGGKHIAVRRGTLDLHGKQVCLTPHYLTPRL